MRTVQMPRPQRLIKTHFRVADAWARAVLSKSRNSHALGTWQKGGAGIEAPLSIHPAHYGAPKIFHEK